MYLGSWKIDDYLTFPANTHLQSTGAAQDDDANPTFRVYEDETGTAIANGSMAKLDDSSTTGFYSERIQLLTATGFEAGKCYTIYIEATVSSVVHTYSHTFQIQAEVALHADWVNAGRLDAILDAIAASTDDWDEAGRLDTILDSIVTKVSDWDNAGRLDTILDAIALSVADWDNAGRLDTILDSILLKVSDWDNAGRLDTILDAVITHLLEMKGATFAEATDSLEAIRDQGDAAWLTGFGVGAITWPYNVVDSQTGYPLADCDVWATTDAAGQNVVASGKTDNNGDVTFYLDAATYYIWRQKAGYNFANPDTEIVV
jgi:hypothetical protein